MYMVETQHPGQEAAQFRFPKPEAPKPETTRPLSLQEAEEAIELVTNIATGKAGKQNLMEGKDETLEESAWDAKMKMAAERIKAEDAEHHDSRSDIDATFEDSPGALRDLEQALATNDPFYGLDGETGAEVQLNEADILTDETDESTQGTKHLPN